MIAAVLARLMTEYGPQHWWPGDSDFEIAAGAVLVQNAAWRNAEAALANLRGAGRLSAPAVAALSADTLQALLRPSGTYRVKAKRLTALARWWLDVDMDRLAGWPDRRLRSQLLTIPGIGPETADCIALYAFRRPVFVADRYAQRLLHRLGAVGPELGYEQLRTHVQSAVPADPAWLNEAHAVIVAHGQRHCRQVARCDGCAVRPDCHLGRRQ